jgi:predicted nucleic acid-binding protein
VKPLIFDSSPLSHFARAGRLAALDRLTSRYRRVIPRAVLDEIRAGETQFPPLADVPNADWLEVVACDGLAELQALAHYFEVLGSGQRDIGEASVLAWAEVNDAVAVLDERAATWAAQQRGVAVHGTLWLIANGVPERMPAQTQAGNLTLRKVSKTDRAALYTTLVLGHLLITFREAFAVAPGITAVRSVVLQDAGPDAYGRTRLECLVAGHFVRSAFDGVHWQEADAGRIVEDTASELLVNLRTGKGCSQLI